VDRVHYRRVTPSRLNNETRGETRSSNPRAERTTEEPTAVENILLQCIVSGVLVVAVLLISISNIAPATALRETLRQTLSGAETPRELFAEVIFFGGELLGGGTEPLQVAAPVLPAQDVTANEQAQYEPIPYEPTPTAEYELLNPQIPGPLAVPELWD